MRVVLNVGRGYVDFRDDGVDVGVRLKIEIGKLFIVRQKLPLVNEPNSRTLHINLLIKGLLL